MSRAARLRTALLLVASLALLGRQPTAAAAPRPVPEQAPVPAPYPAPSRAVLGQDPPPGCSATTTVFYENAPTPILDFTTITRTLTVSGLRPETWLVTAVTNISHTFPSDLNVYLDSPHAGRGTLTTGNGGTHDNVFASTTWADSSNLGVTEVTFVTNSPQYGLIPEGAMGQYRFQDPNGPWNLVVSDTALTDTGTLNSWQLYIATLNEKLIRTNYVDYNGTNKTINNSSPATSTITVSGAGHYLVNLTVTTAISHSASSDLRVILTAPNGISTTLTDENGGLRANLFNGTLWTDTPSSGPGPVTDATYVNGVPLAQVQPEGAMGHFVGVDPNGVWTLTVKDLYAGDNGVLDEWLLSIDTGYCQPIYLPRVDR